MKQYLDIDPWNIVETGFHRQHNKISESIFSIGNGRMGQRANFEEHFSGETMQGTYLAGIYYPDKTRVGWWKNGYPEYFAKVLNAPNWIGIDIEVDGEMLDLAKCDVDDFVRTLNMKEGYLDRSFQAKLPSGKIVRVQARRFCSMVDDTVGAIRYTIEAVNFSGTLKVTPYLDSDIENEDANYDEKFWIPIHASVSNDAGFLIAETKKTTFQVCTGMRYKIVKNGEAIDVNSSCIQKEKYVACPVDVEVKDGGKVTIYKYAANVTSENEDKEELLAVCTNNVDAAFEKGFDVLLEAHKAAWAEKWKNGDIEIEGDASAQQAIRFNIFQLNQTYTGEDERLNIGPKGFTGEKYGGSTYWDTEAYCLPFYLSTAPQKVARNLLVYRYKHLQKAIENAEKLGFKDGAALYPMVTMNGEECHNEWEITFEEIHRNGAIAFAIFNYIRYTGDKDYLLEYGAEVLIGIARFWSQRIHFSEQSQQYMMHGVTGPNEYENNVNNNWYTNYIAVWCLKYAMEAIAYYKQQAPAKWTAFSERIKFYEQTETNRWTAITENMYLGYDEEKGVFLQQDNFLDKEIIPVAELADVDRPLNQNWSWDRILRSCFIKQADVLQGIYFFEDHFEEDMIRRNFDFYEPLTVHESSLSPCVHGILATKLGKAEKAYEMYLRTARLDLDDYNNDTEDGCHITSMAGTWLAVVEGFGGMRVRDHRLQLSPALPEKWTSMTFKILFRGQLLSVYTNTDEVKVINHGTEKVAIKIFDTTAELAGSEEKTIAYQTI